MDNKMCYVFDGDNINDIYYFDGLKANLNIENNKIFNYYTNRQGNNTFINFVGFIILKDITIVCFPKNYSNNVNSHDVTLLSRFLTKILKSKNGIFASNKKDNICSFPINSYLFVIDYFLKYGLYKNQKKVISSTNKGKVNWNYSLRKSRKYISKNGNIIFSNYYMNSKLNVDNFITKCMKFVLYDGYFKVGQYLQINMQLSRKIALRNNKKSIIGKLYSYLNGARKDLDKKLIYNLIQYFKWEVAEHSDVIFLGINFFETVWEKITRNILNNEFEYVSRIIERYIGVDLGVRDVHFKKMQQYFGKDEKAFRSGQYDDICVTSKHVLIFDAKYYKKLEKLDYKQIAYHLFISAATFENTNGEINNNSILGKRKFDCLILPGQHLGSDTLIDMSYASKLNSDLSIFKDFTIYILYLPIRSIMKFVINNDIEIYA